MKNTRKLCAAIAAAIAAALILASCSAAGDNYAPGDVGMYDAEYNEMYSIAQGEPDDGFNMGKLKENPFVKTADEPVSTFSADVDTASYTMLRRLIKEGYDLKSLKSTAGANIRTEELINYFRYDCRAPGEGELFGVTAKLVPCPWNASDLLLTMTLATNEPAARADNNIVLLVDVSGSMRSDDKLPLLKRTFSYLLSGLDKNDTVSIVTYSSGERVVLEGCPGDRADTIQQALDSLQANGATNGEAGLQKAYEIAEKYAKQDGNNRIIMASDGDLNVGMSSVEEIKAFVEQKRDAGVYLSVLGFGYGNYRDAKMETIADSGNGVYYYIDGEEEAEKIFCDDLLATLYTAASDVKLQIAFDAQSVSAYRLIGYENRVMSAEDFDNDAKDAGDVGAGHSVTVCYEIVPAEGIAGEEKMLTLSVRYKEPGGVRSTLNEYGMSYAGISCEPDADTDLIAALCELGMILHGSQYGKDIDMHDVVTLLHGHDYASDPYKAGFVGLVDRIAG